MFLSTMDVVVPSDVFARAQKRDAAAVEELRRHLSGVVLAMHIFPVDPLSEIVVRVEELVRMGVIKTLTLGVRP